MVHRDPSAIMESCKVCMRESGSASMSNGASRKQMENQCYLDYCVSDATLAAEQCTGNTGGGDDACSEPAHVANCRKHWLMRSAN